MNVPGPFAHYFELLDAIPRDLRPRLYVEIGVNQGDSLRLVGPGTRAIGVDPEPQVEDCPAGATIVAATSDEFFAAPTALDGERIDLEFLVQRQCRDTAAAVGLHDRGVLAPGYRADLNVIDFDRLRVHRPELLYDLPAGGRRIVQRADGYVHTVVAGIETYAEGEATGDLPGRLVRGARPGP